ncbi:cytochrome c oxidase subunit II [Arenibaculum sp.]|jgi:cytochrome c oxidase subunit 2|uniref:cytochrome c oxidase subunit II n=1 Tax=Arenibaculum sp. TaxID=2865862 RepID=UPI002E1466D5|nr:cytochrome c oxidase subunit II [Arenibaculum sp.]
MTATPSPFGPSGRRRTAQAAARLAAAGALLAGCASDGSQSALNPKSPDAALIAQLWWWFLGVSAVVLAVVVLVLAVGLLRGRGAQGARPLPESRRWALVVSGGIVAPAVAILGIVVSGLWIGRETGARPTPPDVTVEVAGKLWWWEVRYRDAQGGLIATTANEIHLPVGRMVRLLLLSDNVIHSFWVPNLDGKTDMIPGQVNELWFAPGEAGTYRGQCAELCGVQHALMGFLVVATEPAEFEAWLAHQARPAAEPEGALARRGREVFQQSCARCHTVRGTAARGGQGPDLTHLAGRRTLAAATIPNTRGHLGGWIADPQSIKPGNLMPGFALDPPDLHALLAYLEQLE